jgi:hypothetical protein
MDWFQQLRAALAEFYPMGSPQDVVGYLQGSADPKVWRSMIKGGREQMIILGSVPPTDAEWSAAGVAQRGAVQPIRFGDLQTFIITFGGFMVTRPWGKISTLSVDVFRGYGSVTIPQFKAELTRRAAGKAKQKADLVKAMNNVIDGIESRWKEGSSDHKTQEGIITGSQGNFTGVWGYWTNHLFNTDIPPQQIWTECFSEIAHARSTLKEGKFGESGKSIIRARAALLQATGIYYRWKAGIDGAGTQMQLAIGVAAVALIFAAAAATVASAGAAGAAGASAAGAAEGTSATAAVTRLGSLVTQADTLLVRVATTAPGGITAPSAVAYEQALVELADGTVELLELAAGG